MIIKSTNSKNILKKNEEKQSLSLDHFHGSLEALNIKIEFNHVLTVLIASHRYLTSPSFPVLTPYTLVFSIALANVWKNAV